MKIQQDLFGFACISRKISIFAALNRTEAAGKADNLNHSQAKGRQETAKTLKPMGRWDRTGEKEKMKNTSRTFQLFLTALLLLCGSLAFGQDRTLRTEDDGFKWYELELNGYCGAQSTNGTTLIPLSRKYTFICYHSSDGGWFSFRKNNSSTYEGCCDKNGREIIAVERGYNKVYKVYYYGDDSYIKVKKNGLEGACDLNGREIIAPKYESLILSSSGEFKYKNSQGEWVSTGIKYDRETGVYANASSSSSSSASSSSSNSSSSSSNSGSGSTESVLLYEGDYTEDATMTVSGFPGPNGASGYPHHVKIYEDHLVDNGIEFRAKGVRVYGDGMNTYQVDYDFNIIKLFTSSFGTSYLRFNKKGSATYNVNQLESQPISTPNQQTISTPTSGPSKVKCSYCNGTGKVAKNTYPPQFGTQDYKVRCPECGEEHWKSDGHVHVPCPSCNGRGYK